MSVWVSQVAEGDIASVGRSPPMPGRQRCVELWALLLSLALLDAASGQSRRCPRNGALNVLAHVPCQSLNKSSLKPAGSGQCDVLVSSAARLAADHLNEQSSLLANFNTTVHIHLLENQDVRTCSLCGHRYCLMFIVVFVHYYLDTSVDSPELNLWFMHRQYYLWFMLSMVYAIYGLCYVWFMLYACSHEKGCVSHGSLLVSITVCTRASVNLY